MNTKLQWRGEMIDVPQALGEDPEREMIEPTTKEKKDVGGKGKVRVNPLERSLESHMKGATKV